MQATTADLIRLWGVRIPFVLILSKMYGFNGIFYAMIISNIGALIIVTLFLRLGNWKQRVVEEYH
ncbi:MAG: hypothetical protein U9N62_07925 [Thermotogota bacterium]|nr:hypothetical protein [Thermotogota bacterium]